MRRTVVHNLLSKDHNLLPKVARSRTGPAVAHNLLSNPKDRRVHLLSPGLRVDPLWIWPSMLTLCMAVQGVDLSRLHRGDLQVKIISTLHHQVANNLQCDIVHHLEMTMIEIGIGLRQEAHQKIIKMTHNRANGDTTRPHHQVAHNLQCEIVHPLLVVSSRRASTTRHLKAVRSRQNPPTRSRQRPAVLNPQQEVIHHRYPVQSFKLSEVVRHHQADHSRQHQAAHSLQPEVAHSQQHEAFSHRVDRIQQFTVREPLHLHLASLLSHGLLVGRQWWIPELVSHIISIESRALCSGRRQTHASRP